MIFPRHRNTDMLLQAGDEQRSVQCHVADLRRIRQEFVDLIIMPKVTGKANDQEALDGLEVIDPLTTEDRCQGFFHVFVDLFLLLVILFI